MAEAKLQAALTIVVQPFGDGAAELLAGAPTFRAAIKSLPTGTPYVLTSTGTAGDDSYTFSFTSVDSHPRPSGSTTRNGRLPT